MLIKIVLLTIGGLMCATTAFAEVNTTKAVIHHTAGNKAADKDLSAAEINRIHKLRGWNGIGYHFVIRKNGSVEPGRAITKKGAHAKGRNNYIGIALTGYDTFTVKQKKSLVRLLRQLKVEHIERHHEECPGSGLDMETMRGIL